MLIRVTIIYMLHFIGVDRCVGCGWWWSGLHFVASQGYQFRCIINGRTRDELRLFGALGFGWIGLKPRYSKANIHMYIKMYIYLCIVCGCGKKICFFCVCVIGSLGPIILFSSKRECWCGRAH